MSDLLIHNCKRVVIANGHIVKEQGAYVRRSTEIVMKAVDIWGELLENQVEQNMSINFRHS